MIRVNDHFIQRLSGVYFKRPRMVILPDLNRECFPFGLSAGSSRQAIGKLPVQQTDIESEGTLGNDEDRPNDYSIVDGVGRGKP